MKKFLFMILLVLFTFSMSLEAGTPLVENPDKPLKGQWDFKLQKVWLVDRAGDALFAHIYKFVVNDEETLIVHDDKNEKFFIFDKNGKFVKAFGAKGEGPSEFKRLRRALVFDVKDKLAFADMENIHYFSYNGEFIRSVRNDIFVLSPKAFINDDEFIAAPWSVIDVPWGTTKGKIVVVNFKTQKKTTIAEFDIFKGGYAIGTNPEGQQYVKANVIQGLSPYMTIAYQDGKVYYGMNDKYVINVADLNGKLLNSFSITGRKKKEVSLEDKKKVFLGHDWQPEMLRDIIKSLPDEETYFTHIEVYQGIVYVLLSYLHSPDTLHMDIFSPEGKYLYQAQFKPGDNLNISVNVTRIVITKGHIYIALENEDGDQMMGKYKINIPEV